MSEERMEEYALIDQGAPRTNQAVVATVVVMAFILDQSWLLPVVSLMLYAGVAFGREYLFPYYVYFHWIQQRTGVVWMEDERAPRFAQAMGATGLLVGYAFILAGSPTIGWGLVFFLAAAALMSTFFGICLGCLTYRLIARLRGIKPVRPSHIELADIEIGDRPAGDGLLVEFGHPLCNDCQRWEQRLLEQGRDFVSVDVREQPELARKYGIALLPTVFEVAGDGRVLRQLAP